MDGVLVGALLLGQVAGLGQNRARCHPEVNAQFAGHNLGQRRLAKPRRAMEERMVHRLPTPPGALNKDLEIGARFGLADKFVKHLWTQRAVVILGHWRWAKGGVRFAHALPFRREVFQSRTDQCRRIKCRVFAERLCHSAGRISRDIAQILQR